MAIQFCTYYKSPIGLIEIMASEKAISSLRFTERKGHYNIKLPEILKRSVDLLDAYFHGDLKFFNLSVDLGGMTPFQKNVIKQICTIPYSQTTTYKNIAKAIGSEKSFRAVAHTIAQNPILIIVPCHRIIGENGSLTGYSGGIERKKWLLEHEAHYGLGVQKIPLKF